MGAAADSYYEYLLKVWLASGKKARRMPAHECIDQRSCYAVVCARQQPFCWSGYALLRSDRRRTALR